MNQIQTIDLVQIPTTRYRGSKRKLLNWIYESLKNIEFETVLDVFGGTATVSYLFKKMGKQVTYNDFLKFNTIIGKSIIENSDYTLSANEIEEILSIEFGPEMNFISKNFTDIFYTTKENEWLDKIIYQINKKNFNEKTEFKRAIAFNAVFQACLIKRPFNLFHRRNLNLRLKDVPRNFGNKTTWEKSFESYFRLFTNEINSLVFNSGKKCIAKNDDVFDLPNNKYDLVYLDPPYVLKNSRNESANYLQCYHFLEGLSIYEEWDKYINYKSRILKFSNNYLSNYFTVSQVQQTFTEMIKKFSESIIVISYKFGGIPSINEIIYLLEQHGKKVSTYNKHYKYALNKQNGDALLNREFLIIGE